MPWYWWVLIWVFVLLVTFGVFAASGLSLFRKAKALGRELSEASERLSEVSQALEDLAERTSDPAVFSTASQVRQEQILDGRRKARSKGRQTGHSPQPGARSARSSQQRVR